MYHHDARAAPDTRISHNTVNILTCICLVTENLNQWYQAGDQAYILVASAMVLIMVPGLAFLYSGLARRKSALSLIWACMFSASVITFQWYFWGYSLAFGPSTNGFIGNLDKFGLKGVLGAPSQGSPLIPELLYSFYQVRRMSPSRISCVLTSPVAAILRRHGCYRRWLCC
jgi:Amt family ammonium transporter